jgi:DNA-binding CsgD family transcriptional regulator
MNKMPGENARASRTRSARTPAFGHEELFPSRKMSANMVTDSIGNKSVSTAPLSAEKKNLMTKADRWHLAQSWVKSNKVLIWCIAGPYYKFMSCEPHDVEGEALLAAYKVLTLLNRQQKSLSLMNPYFRVVFRTRCIGLTSGLPATEYEIEQIPAAEWETCRQEEPDENAIRASLEVLTNRQRQISEWILAQPTPVSTTTIGNRFGIGSRTVRAILSNAIKRIEQYGCQPVREGVTTAA